MMYVLLLVSILMCVGKNALYNVFAKHEKPSIGAIFLFNGFAYAVAALITLVCGIGNKLSAETLVIALAYAICVFSLQLFSILAMCNGQMSLTTLIVTYGMLIPALAGPVFWHEEFGIMQAIGVFVMLVSLWLLRDNGADKAKLSGTWILFAVICFLLSGLAGLLEKLHQSADACEERRMFIFIACAAMFTLSMCGMLIKGVRPLHSLRCTALTGIATGAIVSLYFLVNLTLAGKMDSLIYYPIANGGAVPLTVLISIVCFKEKPSAQRLFGFCLGLVSIILLSGAA